MLNYKRYKRVPVVDFPERTWPNKEIMKAPVWCSVDLRDGRVSCGVSDRIRFSAYSGRAQADSR